MGTIRGHIPTSGEWQFDRVAKRLGGWLTGYGLLSLNIGLFLLTSTGLFLLNLYRDPRDIDVLKQLRFWALVIIFHAIAVTVFWIMSWALRAERTETVSSMQLDSPPTAPYPAIGSGEPYGRTRFSPTVSTPVEIDDLEETEHFWRRRSTSILHRQEPGRQETWQWSTTDEAELTRTWPEPEVYEGPVRSPDLDASPEDEPAGAVGDHVVGVVYDPRDLDEPESPDAGQPPEDKVLDPLRFAGRQQDTESSNGNDGAMTRWLWVEAAAAAWLAQRQDAEIEEHNDYVIPNRDSDPPDAKP